MLIAFSQTGCRKDDIFRNTNEKNAVGIRDFFTKDPVANLQVQRVMNELQRQNNSSGNSFVKSIIGKHGYARWDKSFTRIIKPNHATSFSKMAGEGNDTVVIVPLVKDEDEQVEAYLEAHLTEDVKINLRTAGEYRKMSFSNVKNEATDAEVVAIRFMLLTKELYGFTNYKITDERLFNSFKKENDTSKSWITVDLTTNSESLIYNETCIKVRINVDCPVIIEPIYTAIAVPKRCYETRDLCYHWWEEESGGGTGNNDPGSGGTGTGEGGNGSGSGGTGTGGDGDPCGGNGLIVNGILPPGPCDTGGDDGPGWFPELEDDGDPDPCETVKAQEATNFGNSTIFQNSKSQIQNAASDKYEHAISFGKNGNGSIIKSEMSTGTEVSGSVPFISNKFADIHNHQDNGAPSPGDIYAFIDGMKNQSDFSTRFVTASGGDVYALVVTDKQAAINFNTIYPRFIGTYTDPNDGSTKQYPPAFPDEIFDKGQDISRYLFSNGITSKLQRDESSLTFILQHYNSGISLLKLNSSGEFKKLRTKETNTNGTISYTIENCL